MFITKRDFIIFILLCVIFYNSQIPSYIVPVQNVGVVRSQEQTHMSIEYHGNYVFVKNMEVAAGVFSELTTVTMVTQSDFRFLDNLLSLALLWDGPISVAVFAPADEYGAVMDHIQFVRTCFVNSPHVREKVSFHLYFDTHHIPRDFAGRLLVYRKQIKCESLVGRIFFDFNPILGNVSAVNFAVDQMVLPKAPELAKKMIVKSRRHYPINVGRNLARSMAHTHYVFVNDIELYPSSGVVREFFGALRREVLRGAGGEACPERQDTPYWPILCLHPPATHTSLPTKPRVFVLPVFESASPERVLTKYQLRTLYKQKVVKVFHAGFCTSCHRIPRFDEWLRSNGGGVFGEALREGPFRHWEPMYIGTKEDPPYYEMQAWEDKSDKMIQAGGIKYCLFIIFIMCFTGNHHVSSEL